MPFDPRAPTPESRGVQFGLMYLALFMTCLCVVQYVLDPDLNWMSIGYGIMMGGLINAALGFWSDSYFRAQCYVGMSWSAALLAIYLFVLMILRVSDIPFVTGYRAVADGEVVRIPMNAAAYVNDASVLAMLLALAFYSGFVFAMLRDRYFAGGDEE